MCVLFSTQTYPIFVTGTTGSSCKEQFCHVEKFWHVEKFEFYNMEKICHVELREEQTSLLVLCCLLCIVKPQYNLCCFVEKFVLSRMAQFCHKDSLSLFTHFCVETNLWYASKYKSSRTDNTDFDFPGLKQDLIREHLHLQQQTLSESWLNLGQPLYTKSNPPEQARKPRSYASPKLCPPTYPLTY